MSRLVAAPAAEAAWRLSEAETENLIEALVARSRVTAARIGQAIRRELSAHGGDHCDPALAFHRLVTRNRFLKGSRTLFPCADAVPAIRRFTDAGAPVRLLVRGFPFKQCDNGLKAAGPLPDLAEVGALVRLLELQLAFLEVYPPGLRVTVLCDGGYYRPRPAADLTVYRGELARLVSRIGADGFLTFEAQADVLATAVGAEQWHERRRLIGQAIDAIGAEVEWARGRHAIDAAAKHLSRRALVEPDVPPFDAVFRSLLYSVPVPGGGSQEWATTVLCAVWDLRAPEPLRRARLVVRERAWQDTIRYLATATVDQRLGAFTRLPPHVRLVTGAPRPGAFGFSYLGGSTLLPWHGTGYVDRRGRVGVDFLIALLGRGYIPVYSELLAADQPWCMLSPVVADQEWAISQLQAAIRLKSR